MGSEEGSQPNSGQTLAFVRAFATLKREGSTLFVTGNTPLACHQQACLRTLGDETAGVRRRVIVLTDTHRTAVSETVPPPQLTTDPRTVITYQCNSRSANTPPQNEELPVTPTRVETGHLPALEATLSESITTIKQDTDLSPAELRVCVDSLVPLVYQHDRDAIEQFLRAIAERIRNVCGMGHFHFPVERDRELVREFAPLFDAELELRVDDHGMQQRWHLQSPDLTSEWLALE